MNDRNQTTKTTVNANGSAKTDPPPRGGFFKRVFDRIDNALKAKAEAKSDGGCCTGNNDRSGGGCC